MDSPAGRSAHHDLTELGPAAAPWCWGAPEYQAATPPFNPLENDNALGNF